MSTEEQEEELELEEETEPEAPAPVTTLTGPALIKEVSRLIRLARTQWDAHNNASARRERGRALRLYNTLTPEQKDQIPQVLRVWLRYRSEKYLGARPGKKKKKKKTA
jgi:hypothetical protein